MITFFVIHELSIVVNLLIKNSKKKSCSSSISYRFFQSKSQHQNEGKRLLESSKKTDTTHIRVLQSDHEKLVKIKRSVGFKSLACVVHSLLEEQAKNLVTVEAVLDQRVPVVLTGPPRCGKSFFVKHKLLPSLTGHPVLVIDNWDEYKQLRSIGYDIYSLNFKDFNEKIRFVPNTQSRVAETEVENIFSHLDMKRKEMSDWIIIVEEAHAFKNISAFNKFLYGSRHIVRKMVVVTPQTDAFKGLVTLTAYH